MVPQHVEQRHLDHDGAEQVGALGEHRAGEEPAVGPTAHRQSRGRGIALRDQPLRGGNAVVEGVLLPLQHSRLVPRLAVLPAAPQVGHRQHPAPLEPEDQRAGERRRHADVEAAVAGEVGRIGAVERHAARMHHEHGDRRRILRRAGHLLHLELLRIDPRLDAAPALLHPALEIDAVDRRRIGIRREAVEQLLAVPLGAHAVDRAERGELDPASAGAVVPRDDQPRGRALEVAQRQVPARQREALEHGLRMRRRHRSPALRGRLLRIGGVEPAGRGVEIGAHPEPPVGHVRIEQGGTVADDGHQRPAALAILQVDVGLVEGARDRDHQPAPVGRE